MGIKIFKKLRRKRTASLETKANNHKTKPLEKNDDDIVTPQTSESTTEDDNLEDKVTLDNNCVFSTVHEDESRPSNGMESQESGSELDETGESTPYVDYSGLFQFDETNKLANVT